MSVGRLLGGDGTVSLYSHTSLSRDACEAAVRIHWLLDPAVDARQRAVRGAVSWYNGMLDQRRGAAALPAGHPACNPQATQRLNDQKDQYLQLATTAGMSMPLDSKGKNIAAFELDGVRTPVRFNVSERMATALPDVPSWYAISSAASHSSTWILLDAVTSPATDDFLRLSPDLGDIGAAAISIISATSLVITTYAHFHGHDPTDRIAKATGRRNMIDQHMRDEFTARAAPTGVLRIRNDVER